jgi:DNA-binding NtrC family response regulator
MPSPTMHNVLVVDDQANWRAAISTLLQTRGLEVDEAKTFQEAQAKIGDHAYHVVVLDVRFVDEDPFNVQGLELLRYIKALSPATKAVILTGYSNSIIEGSSMEVFHKVPPGSRFDSVGFAARIQELVTASIEDSRPKTEEF